MKIAIIGGTRGLGKWIASFLKEKGFQVTITSRDELSGNAISKKLDVTYSSDSQKVAGESDIVIISVPIESTESVIKQVAPHMSKGSLLMDVTSVKEKPAILMHEYLAEGAYFLPSHPMFGPRVRSLEGQVIVLTPLQESEWFNTVFKFLEDHKARVLVTTPEKHDEMMSVVQVLTHFAYISISSTIKKLNLDIKESRKFASPIYNLMLDIISRIVAQNPYLVYSIQTQTDYAYQARKIFMETINELNDMLINNNQTEFVNAMSSAAKNMDDIEAALGRSDKVISALNQEISALKESINSEVFLRHIYSGKTHYGILKEISPDFVTLISGKKTLKLKIANIEVLSPSQVQDWKLNNFKQYEYHISVLFPSHCDPQIIASTISNLEGVVIASIMDIYQGEQIDDNQISITFSYKVLEARFVREVENLLKGFGAIIR
ncbi:MAG: prephenate dehydrogenase [Methanobacteriaceae archaeon]|nr:prephenate dehydrogenase [Methanobacteriaceae archaeon]MDP2836862.1 prephenate dehydrogenase [Methanobacteriaceae archaeon]MDP3485085.1 prephenate dehydrogenase [Methanobacteriaceae archaeon]MDP3623863.1 prephenate dehydrogenase [Methanobacteriaceae archaeon]